jgi:hypothetical protein
MNPTVKRLHSWLKQTPLLSRWPGSAVRKQDGEPDFIRGVVIRVTELSVHVETERHTLVKLLGDAYPHVCDSCQNTVPGNVSFKRPPELRPFCPWCGPPHLLRMMKVGEKVRVHHRFGVGSGLAIQDDQTAWGAWYGEKWNW